MTVASGHKVAIVTGAGGDIGLETIRCLKRDGWTICATSLEETDALTQTLTYDDIVVAADVTDSSAVSDVVAQCVQKYGRMDGLVNCAGASGVARFHEQTDDSWHKFVDINLNAAFYISKAFIDEALKLPKTDRSIVLISSLAAIAGGANPAYGAAKAGVCTMCFNMAQAYADDHIRANAVLPGIIDTQMVRNAFPGEKYDRLKAAASARTPSRRLGKPIDVAELCAFLLSEKSSFITGQAINITGGFELVPPIGNIQ
ncbi:SDR family NAD(P)-dependent oxidoreductase [Sulfitobacter mediterraneus]|uniref:SDR family NAD(P)-dependent oxidoreductase n=1 Tax=Sulfitobacter mediterraneus TaxID=83219 RepID=UPI0021A4FD19|nr:SDR family NAD(P)-dependent oxidoreductase [Sulfitobacter mediterraneus]UWR13413.1 SDR family oxidoreductase [Sulfitobacter mediterraneus]